MGVGNARVSSAAPAFGDFFSSHVTQAVLSCKLASVLVGRAPPGEDGVTWSSKAGHHAMSDSGLLLSLIKLGLYQARWSPVMLNKKTGKVATVGSYIVT